MYVLSPIIVSHASFIFPPPRLAWILFSSSQNHRPFDSNSLKQIILAIRDRIRDFSKIADVMKASFDHTRVRLRGTMNRTLRMAEKTGVGWRVMLRCFAAVIFVFLVGVVVRATIIEMVKRGRRERHRGKKWKRDEGVSRVLPHVTQNRLRKYSEMFIFGLK